MFDPFTKQADVDLNRCTGVPLLTGVTTAVDSNVCYMHSGLFETAGGVDSIYQLMSPEGGRTLCI